SSRRRHTRSDRDWSSDVCSSDLMRNRHIVRRRINGFERIFGFQVDRDRDILQWLGGELLGVERVDVFEQPAISGQQLLIRDFDEIGRASCRERVWVWV